MSLFARFIRNESGATMIEYSLIAAGLAVAMIVIMNQLGTSVDGSISEVSDGLSSSGAASP